jgi:hypothetical protein
VGPHPATDASQVDQLKRFYAKLAQTNTYLTDTAAEQKTYYDKVQLDAYELQLGYDGLATANQQLADDAVVNKASYDTQKAHYDQLQVGGNHSSAECQGHRTLHCYSHQVQPVCIVASCMLPCKAI